MGAGGIASLAAGRRHSLALLSQPRKVYAWGSDNNGQLGVPPAALPQVVPTLKTSGVSSPPQVSPAVSASNGGEAPPVSAAGSQTAAPDGLNLAPSTAPMSVPGAEAAAVDPSKSASPAANEASSLEARGPPPPTPLSPLLPTVRANDRCAIPLAIPDLLDRDVSSLSTGSDYSFAVHTGVLSYALWLCQGDCSPSARSLSASSRAHTGGSLPQAHPRPH